LILTTLIDPSFESDEPTSKASQTLAWFIEGFCASETSSVNLEPTLRERLKEESDLTGILNVLIAVTKGNGRNQRYYNLLPRH